MELTPRKQAVLKAIIKAYIKTGEPIGSKNLVALLENAPSSATIRNEMSELCELGFLKQPHTSAGRIPTVSGYKFYLDTLPQNCEPTKEEQDFIDFALSDIHCGAEEMPATAAQVLSSLTGLPVISCCLTERSPKIKEVKLLRISECSVILIIITDDGRTRNRIFRHSKDFISRIEAEFQSIAEHKIKGKRLNELTLPYIQSAIIESGAYSLELIPLLTAVFETALEIEETDVTLQGESALYNICGSEQTAKQIISLIKRRDPIISLFENIGDTAQTVFGSETGYEELKSDALVAAKFNAGVKYKGYLAVIGPKRISYEKILPCTQYAAKKLTEIMTEAQKDMED